MVCKYCTHTNPNLALYCCNCGKSLLTAPRRCPSCGSAVANRVLKCRHCNTVCLPPTVDFGNSKLQACTSCDEPIAFGSLYCVYCGRGQPKNIRRAAEDAEFRRRMLRGVIASLATLVGLTIAAAGWLLVCFRIL